MIRFLFALLLMSGFLPAQVDLTEAPVSGRLYARDLVTNQAVVPISGAVTTPNVSRIHLVVTRDGSPWWNGSVNLSYSGGSAPFSFAPTIDAGLHDYDFELLLEIGGQVQQIGFVDRVVCGDVILINGQSNAVAADYHGEGLANQSQSRWIRSFGTSALGAIQVAADLDWHLAEGQGMYSSGTVGTWALRAARLLVDTYQVPIALINGAVGGTYLMQHMRDDTNPENLGTIYGRLLFRARQSGIDQNVRAMLWHQGESDGGTDPTIYHANWSKLRDDWYQDFPSLEQVFMFQIRDGCGVNGMGIRELQRRSSDLFTNVTVLSSTAINAHDGCHFFYQGYRKMGNLMGAAIAVILYGASFPPALAPANIKEARFTSSARDEIELVFRNSRQVLILDQNIEAHFNLGAGVLETVTTATASAGKITLQLSGSTASSEVAYDGHVASGPWIRNRKGVGAFTFMVPVLP